ncbi:MAG: exonuclease/endonuclease/phosphatase family protein [Planctomycetota bacterium]|jgi:hypothetical protein
MRRLIVVAVVVALATGGAYCYVNYDFEIRRGQDGLELITVRPKDGGSTPGVPFDASLNGPIRIGTFNLGRLNQKKLDDPLVGTLLAKVIPRFDVLAVQGIGVANRRLLVRLVDQINAGGRQYDFATAPAGASDPAGQYTAFLFNRATIEIDRSTVLSVGDAAGRFNHRPLVALFRVRGPEPTDAFTFKLINVHTDSDRPAVGPELLDDVLGAVRKDQPEEDDVILLGTLGTSDDGLDRMDEMPGLTSAISDTPTSIRGTRPVDNILFDPRLTVELTGRSGVLDLMREFDLTWREVSEVSEHLPVWAEFSPLEGGRSGHLADRTRPKTR